MNKNSHSLHIISTLRNYSIFYRGAKTMMLNNHYHRQTVINYFCCLSKKKVELDSDVPSVVQLAHSFGPNGEFEPRGQINVRSLRAGSFSVQQDSLFDLKSLQVFL